MKLTNRNKPRICYFRGSYLNPFETQYLEPLRSDFDLTVGYTRSHRFNIDSISLPRVMVNCADYMNGLVPRQIKGHHVPNVLKVLGYDEVLLGYADLLSKFELIHVQEQAFYSTWQIARAKKRHGFKLVVVQAEVNPYWYTGNRAIRGRAGFVREQADVFIARSARAKAALVCEGVPPERIRVIGHGVDPCRFCPGPKDLELCRALGIDPDRFVVLFVGHLLWTKGIFALASAAKLLFEDETVRRLDPLFVLVGEGGDRRSFEHHLTALGLQKHFLLVGRQPYSRLPEIHRLADVFVLPSISTQYILEQFGIVLIESMATGKPAISTHCGAIDEVVADAGLLVQPNDYLRLAEALGSLCRNESLREELGRRGRERVCAQFTNIGISEKIAAVYREALAL